MVYLCICCGWAVETAFQLLLVLVVAAAVTVATAAKLYNVGHTTDSVQSHFRCLIQSED